MLASSTVYTVVTRLVIHVPSTADDDTGQLHCLPSGFDTVRATPDGVDSRGGEYCVRRRDLCMKHQKVFDFCMKHQTFFYIKRQTNT